MDLKAEISDILGAYLGGHKSRSVGRLAKKASLSENTLRRLLNKEVEPSFDTVLRLLGVVVSQKDFGRIVTKYYPQLKYAMKAIVSGEKDSSQSILTKERAHLIYSRVAYHVFHLASTKNGTTREDIQRILGEQGLESLEQLLSHQLLNEEHGQISNPSKEFYISCTEDALRMMQNSLEIFDTSLIGTDAAALSHQSESINIDGLRKLKELTYEYTTKISELKKDPQYEGDIPFYVTTALNVFDRKNVECRNE